MGFKPNKTGRPTSFTQEVADEILDKLCEGMSLRAACSGSISLPNASTVHRWLTNSDPMFDDFRKQYARARDIGIDVAFDSLLELAALCRSGKLGPKEARAAGYLIERHASKMNRKKYADRVDVNANVKTTGGVLAVPMTPGSDAEWLDLMRQAEEHAKNQREVPDDE